MTVDQKLADFGFTLTRPPAPAANYIPVTHKSNLLFVSGQISAGPTGIIKGHLGRDLDLPDGQRAAALCAVNILAQLRFSAGVDLEAVRMLKLTVLVSSMPHFTDQHLVANGASDLLVGVLGENGRHARAAFGVAALPLDAAVEIEAMAEFSLSRFEKGKRADRKSDVERLPEFDRPIAHRGLHDRTKGRIENSLPAFAAAIDAGFAMECDVQLSGDGKPIVFHDDTLDRLTGQSGTVSMLSAGQATRIPLLDSADGDCPPRFEALLELVAGRRLIVIELKHQPTAAAQRELAAAVAGALAFYGGPVVVESFDPRLLRHVRAAGYRGHLGIIAMRNAERGDGANGFFSEWVLRHMLHWPMSQFSFLSICQADLDLPMVRFWRARGLPVTAWTIRDRDQAEAARTHCDQIVFEGFSPHRG